MTQTESPTLLICDDEEAVRYSFSRMMAREPFQVETCASGREAIERVKQGGIAVVVLDFRLGGDLDGNETLREIKTIDRRIAVILMTAYASANTAIEATRYGAYDYVLKPFENEAMRQLILQAYQAHQAMATAVYLVEKESDEEWESGDCIIGLSPAMQDVYKQVGRIASSTEPVLIRGESGTGKELVARAIYQFSNRKNALFLPVNCGAIPKELLESEFFGHEKGSFTGAHERRIGKFEQADGGMVFLDEVGEMPLDVQVKLLRFLEDRVVTRVGGMMGHQVDVRILAATNRPLEKMVSEGLFREDLYYRLNVVSIELPPLRNRKADIPLLVKYFLRKHARHEVGKTTAIVPEVLRVFESYHWPGNVRELENTIRRLLVQCQDHAITLRDVESVLQKPGSRTDSAEQESSSLAKQLQDLLEQTYQQLQQESDCVPVLNTVESILIRHAMAITEGNQVHAARILGMSRNTLRKRLAETSSEETE